MPGVRVVATAPRSARRKPCETLNGGSCRYAKGNVPLLPEHLIVFCCLASLSALQTLQTGACVMPAAAVIEVTINRCCARARGVGACVATFTVGGLSIINAIAGAYSEDLPVICITGRVHRKSAVTEPVLKIDSCLWPSCQHGLARVSLAKASICCVGPSHVRQTWNMHAQRRCLGTGAASSAEDQTHWHPEHRDYVCMQAVQTATTATATSCCTTRSGCWTGNRRCGASSRSRAPRWASPVAGSSRESPLPAVTLPERHRYKCNRGARGSQIGLTQGCVCTGR